MKIKSINVTGDFKYLWLKTVENVDLSVHCARCLIGKYDNRIKPFKGLRTDLLLTDNIYYLCGVSSPYRWENNFHLAFKPCEGSSVEYSNNGIDIVIENAERIDISDKYIDSRNINAGKRDYFTCRNWQFANWFYQKKIELD